MTEEEYIESFRKRAEEEPRDILQNYLRPFEWVKEYFCDNNMTQKEFDQFLKEVGDEEVGL